MKLYIDFDGTLFDTDRQLTNIIKVCNDYGITEERFREVCKEALGEKNLFDIEKVINCLVSKYNISDEIHNDIDKVFYESYVYSDVIESLKDLIKRKHELYIFTYGDLKYQKRKIAASKLESYFKKVIITQDDKSKIILDKINSVFIDNNPNVVDKLYEAGYKVIRIKRDTDKYSKINTNISEVRECKDFEQVVDFMKGNVK